MDRLRVATLQYFVRPIQSYSQFEDQVRGLIRTAADYECRLLVFPEYFTVQLLTLGDVEAPMYDQVRTLARRAPQFFETMSEFARDAGLYIVAGSIPVADDRNPDKIYNECHVFAPDGTSAMQRKIHMTRFEREVWKVSPGERVHVFDTEFGRMAVAICYDVEFPEYARAVARSGATILVLISYTDDRQGFLRVRYCAHARAIENQMFVVHSATVGSLPMVPAVSLNYGQASILTPSDFPFARDGILAEGIHNQESMLIGELNLRTIRSNRLSGTVRPLRDSLVSHERIGEVKVVELPSMTPAAVQSGKTPPAQVGPRTAGKTTPTPGGARPPATEIRQRRRVVVRNTTEEDFDAIIDLAKHIYPDVPPWSKEQLALHLERFPQGQFVAYDEASGLLLGSCAGLILKWDDYSAGEDWASFTADGTFANHDPSEGRTLFAADVMVRPGQQGRGIGQRLYRKGRFDLARQLGLVRVLAGARLRGYHKVADRMSPEEYTAEVVRKERRDPTLSFQLNQGFRVLTVVGGYFGGDPESRGYAALIEWLNPDVATDADRERGDPRYGPTKGPSLKSV